MLLPGFAIALPAVVITTFLYLLVIERFRWWNERDEDQEAERLMDEEDANGAGTGGGVDVRSDVKTDVKLPSLAAAVAPVVVVLALILVAIVAPLLNINLGLLEFLGSPVIALLAGALTALIITVVKKGLAEQEKEVAKALETVGTILVVTAVAGSLGAIIAGTGMKEVLGELFEANRTLPLLAVWGIAAVLRMAIGGQTVSGITAIGIIAPLISDLGLSPVLVILAAGAGGCFGGQFSDNAFWMLRSLFALSTRGALKTYTLSQSMLSLVVLAIVVAVDLFV